MKLNHDKLPSNFGFNFNRCHKLRHYNVAISMRLEDALEALAAAADNGNARDLASAAAGVVRCGGASTDAGGGGPRGPGATVNTGASTSTASTAARAAGPDTTHLVGSTSFVLSPFCN